MTVHEMKVDYCTFKRTRKNKKHTLNAPMLLFIYQKYFLNNNFLNGPRRVRSIEILKFEIII